MTGSYHLRALWLPGIIALVLLGLGLLIGLDLAHSLLLGAACLAVGVLPSLGAGGIRSRWPALPYGRRDGARRDVSTLTWTLMSREGRLSSKGRQRVHAVVQDALRQRGIDAGTAAGTARAESLLGREVTGWLADPDSRPLDPAQLSSALAALESTSPAPPSTTPRTPSSGARAPSSPPSRAGSGSNSGSDSGSDSDADSGSDSTTPDPTPETKGMP
ncbi:MAG TPA: hypothetical protein VK086_03245 [Ruania sp.]|nr:hypothetical protein [Ruania sp.]